MSVATVTVPTENASRYLQQLCKHWAHKMEVTFTPDEGTINFPNGAVLALDARADALALQLDVPAEDELERMQGVVSSHLDRFAFREAPMRFDWQRG